MGNGIRCATTSNVGVSQGVTIANKIGAPPPPPPTGAVGGGGAPHLSAVVVSQIGLGLNGSQVVSMPQNYLSPGNLIWCRRADARYFCKRCRKHAVQERRKALRT